VTFLTVAFKTLPAGKYKQHDNVELDSKFTAYYVKQVVGGINVVEIDVLANIAKVNGVDILANYRANIGG
jgi:P2 family phage contractile tail tube protein